VDVVVSKTVRGAGCEEGIDEGFAKSRGLAAAGRAREYLEALASERMRAPGCFVYAACYGYVRAEFHKVVILPESVGKMIRGGKILIPLLQFIFIAIKQLLIKKRHFCAVNAFSLRRDNCAIAELDACATAPHDCNLSCQIRYLMSTECTFSLIPVWTDIETVGCTPEAPSRRSLRK
jgi:hypothetical protein